jgi:hypothetical protein
MGKLALPLLKVAVPRLFALSRKVTRPVGVPAPGATAVTVAVRMRGWPKTAELADAETVVSELACFTV